MAETEITFLSDDTRLVGSLRVPEGKGPFPGVLMVAGSGPVDRNENTARLPLNVFGELSGHLAAAGIASLRYDKRGVGASEGDYWRTGFYDNIADARAALSTLWFREEIDAARTCLLGHSEGALITTELAGNEAGVTGAVLLSTSAQRGEAVLYWQGEQVAEGLTGLSGFLVKTLRLDPGKQQRKALEKIKNSREDVVRMQLVAKVNAKWMREFMAFDPSEAFSRISVPVLAVTGSKDIQVDPDDLQRLAAVARTDYESHVVPDVSHILREDPGRPSIEDYKRQVGEPLDRRVVDIIVTWLRRQLSGAT